MLKEIDIGHGNSGAINIERAIMVLSESISKAKTNQKTVAIKIIHGHGSGALKRAVRGFLLEERGRLRTVVFGENYTMFSEDAVQIYNAIKESNPGFQDRDFQNGNSGMTIILL